MGVLSSIVSQAQPALFGNGVTAGGTIGATWLWNFVDFNDTAGDPIDLSAVTGVCKILNDSTGAEIVTLDFDGNNDGTFSVGLDEADTASVPATGNGSVYRWYLTLDDGTDVVQVWGSSPSKFTVKEA